MRITNKMISSTIERNLHRGLDRVSQLHQQLSTGKRISLPHEDPVSIRKALGLNSNLTEIEQYTRNVDQGSAWLTATETAISQVVDSLHKVQELAVRGANGPLTNEDLSKIKSEVDQIYQHIYDLSQTQYDGKYVFSGTETLTAPYEMNGDTVSGYKGNKWQIEYEISKGVKMPVNVVGGDPTDSSKELFGVVFKAIESLRGNLKKVDQGNIDADIGKLQAALENTLDVQAKVGAMSNRLDMAKQRLSADDLNITKLVSETEDIDIAEVIMNLNMQENVYRAALGSAARVIQPSLLDFLR